MSKRLIQILKKEYQAGSHKFSTIGDGSDNIPIQLLVNSNIVDVFTIKGSNVGIGTMNPLVSLDTDRTDAFKLPSGTDLQRPSPAVQGYVRYNTTTSQFEGYGPGNSWGSLGGVKSTDQYTYITAELTPGANDSNIRFYTGATQKAILNSSGNLGIGTTLPKQALDVFGNISITGHIYPSACNVYNLGSSNLRFKDIYLSGNSINLGDTVISRDDLTGGIKITDIYGNLVNMSTSNIIISGSIGIGTTTTRQAVDLVGNTIITSGNLGIGTTAPLYALHLEGNSYLNGPIITNNNNINAGTATITAQTFSGTATQVSNTLTRGTYLTGNNFNGATATTWAVDATTTPTASKVVARDASAYIYSSGVGIGTTTSRQPLDSIGNAIITAGNLGIGTTVPLYALHLEGNSLLNGPIITNNNNINAGTATITAQTFSGTATQVSNTLTRGTYLTGNNFNGATATTWAVDATTTPTASKIVARDESAYVYSSGVGIGTTTSRQPLDSIGNAIITAGNLGIGTTAPLYALHLEGNSLLNGPILTNNNNINAGTATITAQTFSGTATQVSNTLTRGTYLTGNNFNGATATTWAVDATTTPTASKIVARDASAYVYSSGVGIGTTTARQPLDSIGNAIITAGNLGIGTTVPRYALHVEGNSYLNGPIITNNNPIDAGTASITAQTFIGTFSGGVSGTATNVSNFLTPGQYIIGQPFDGSNAYTWDIKASSNFSSPETLVARDITGRITASSLAIGANTTSVALEVNSTDAILLPKGTDVQRPSPAVQGYIRYNTTTNQFEGYGAGNSWGSLGGVKSTDQYTYITAELTPGTNDSNIRFYTGAIQQAILNPNGNLGIGTTSPISKLHVQGNALISGTLTTSNLTVIGDFTTLNTVTSNTEQMVITNNGTGPALKVTQTGNNTVAEFYDAETGIALFIGNNGNIGIGTNSPTVALDVNGAITTNNNNINAGTATITAQTFSGTATKVSSQLTAGQYILGASFDGQTPVTWDIKAASNATGETLVARDASSYIYSSGVGIGTTTARQPLDTIGNAIISGNVGIGSAQPEVSLVINKTDAILLPKGTELQRPSPAVQGYIRYNTTTSQFEGYGAGNSWGSLGGVKSTDQYTYITAELTPGANDSNIRFYTGTTQQAILNPSGNLGIGTTLPQHKLHVEGTIYAPNMQSSNITVVDTISTCNMMVYGELLFGINASTLKTNIQVNPIRKTIYVESDTSNVFYIQKEGTFAASTSNVQVFINQMLLVNLSDIINDYEVTSIYTSSPPVTTFTITLTSPAVFGDVVDITVWPQLIQESAAEPGYVYQQVRVAEAHFDEVNTTDLAYLSGNIGIGTNNTSLGKLVVAGNIVPSACNVYDLGSSNYRFRDLYLSGNTIDLGGTKLSREQQTGGLSVLSSTGQPSDIRTNSVYIANTLEFIHTPFIINAGGNVGIGTTNPREKLEVNGHIIPSSCNLYDLGTPNLRFRDLYLSGNTINMEGNTLTTSASDLFINNVQYIPPGTIIYVAASTAPTGFLKANGSAISRSVYNQLFSRISTTFGAGDGSTTFTLPDLRGEFVRGWDDSRGADSGRAFGNFQDWSIENITGSIVTGHSFHPYSPNSANISGAIGFAGASGASSGGGSGSTYRQGFNFDASRVAKTSTETRPRNISLLACIKT